MADLPGEWSVVQGRPEAAEWKTKTRGQLPSGHALIGVPFAVVAVRRHQKDLILWLPTKHEWAWIHLTYSVETDPRFPWFTAYHAWNLLVEDNT